MPGKSTQLVPRRLEAARRRFEVTVRSSQDRITPTGRGVPRRDGAGFDLPTPYIDKHRFPQHATWRSS